MTAPISNENVTPLKSGRLGKGLSAIFADEDPNAPDASKPRTLPVTQLYPSATQPRRHFAKDALDELAASIKEKGIIQPLLVRPHPSKPSAYEIVAGERRWRAAQLAQLHEVPVTIRAIKDREALELALIENVQRADLSPMEEAESYARLLNEFGHTQEELAGALGKSRTHIANILRLQQLPDTVKELVRQGSLTGGHARALLAAKNPLALANEIIKGGLSVRQTENLVKLGHDDRRVEAEEEVGSAAKGHVRATHVANRTALREREARRNSPTAKATVLAKDADILNLERQVSSWLGLQVKLSQKRQGGTLNIEYKTLDQLEDVLKRLSLPPRE